MATAREITARRTLALPCAISGKYAPTGST
jgi:hypothetical protein